MRERVDAIITFCRKHRLILLIAAAVVLCAAPLVLKTSSTRILCRILMYCTLAGSLNVINGYSGQTCMGQAGFFAIGAYTTAILLARTSLSFWLILPISGVLAALTGLIIVMPTLKMKGIYLSVITLGASEIIRLLALNWTSLTGGAYGMKDIARPHIFGFVFNTPFRFFYLFLAVALVFLLCTRRVLRSRVGRAWMSIREGELAAASLGIAVSRYKVSNFMYGAFWAGIAGSVYAPYLQYIDSSVFALDEGFNILSMVVIGGQGTLIGPIVGSIIVNLLTEALRVIGQWRYVIYAMIIILMMWVRPQGLVGATNSVLSGGKMSAKKLRKAGTEKEASK